MSCLLRPNLEVGVLVLQLEDRGVVGSIEAGDGEAGEIAQECPTGDRPEPLTEQVVDLGGHGRGNDERARLRSQDREQDVDQRLALVGERDERAGVDHERQAPKLEQLVLGDSCDSGRSSPSTRAKPAAIANSRSLLDAGS